MNSLAFIFISLLTIQNINKLNDICYLFKTQLILILPCQILFFLFPLAVLLLSLSFLYSFAVVVVVNVFKYRSIYLCTEISRNNRSYVAVSTRYFDQLKLPEL